MMVKNAAIASRLPLIITATLSPTAIAGSHFTRLNKRSPNKPPSPEGKGQLPTTEIAEMAPDAKKVPKAHDNNIRDGLLNS